MHYVRKWVCGWERQWNFAISSNTFASSACFKIIENRVLWVCVCVWLHSFLLVWELFWSQNWCSLLIFINLQRQALNLCPFSRNKKRFVQSVKPLVLQLTLFLMINSTIEKKAVWWMRMVFCTDKKVLSRAFTEADNFTTHRLLELFYGLTKWVCKGRKKMHNVVYPRMNWWQ